MSADSARIDDAAAEWAARADAGALSPTDAHALDAWLAEDPRHLGAYARASAVLAHFDKAKALGPDFEAPPQPRVSRRAAFSAIAATLAVTAGAGAITYAYVFRRYATKQGEMRRVALPDGSTVTLNTASEVIVDYTGDKRTVRLTRGEALFDVATGAAPFVVEAGGVRLRARKANFNVRQREGRQVEVLVCDGVVNLDGGGKIARLPKATLAYARPAAPVSARAVDGDDVSRKLAWREGMIAFHGETLAEAAGEFARYSGDRILIDDPEVARRTVVGLFVANDPQGFAKAVATSFGLELHDAPEGVRLTAGDSA
ncbi:MAG TPA: FecR domain-containing protein [Caulobacteraceae bacterium]